MDTIKSILNTLTAFAIFVAIINFYLKANKIWKRRHEKEVAASLSVVALISEIVLYLIWSLNFIINSDWSAFAGSAIQLLEACFFVIIGAGIFVAVKKKSKKSFWRMAKDSMIAERKEASFLFMDIVHNIQHFSHKETKRDRRKKYLIYNEELKLKRKKLKKSYLSKVEYEEKKEKIKSDLENYFKVNKDVLEQSKDLKKLYLEIIHTRSRTANHKEREIIIEDIEKFLSMESHGAIPIYKIAIVQTFLDALYKQRDDKL